jgi:hypothetical protein
MPFVEPPKLQQIAAIARQYRIAPRTAYRWLADGVDISNPLEVARHLAGCRAPARAAIEAATEILTDELSKLEP